MYEQVSMRNVLADRNSWT